jgi:hypothetical protein
LASSSPDSDLSSLEETLEIEHAYSTTTDTRPSPTPALTAMAHAVVSGQSVGSKIPPGSRAQDAPLSSVASAAGSPALSLIAPTSLEYLRDGVSSPAIEERSQSLTEPATPPGDGQMDLHQTVGPEVSSTEPEMLHLVTVTPLQSDNFSMADLPQECPRSPVMSLLQSLSQHLPRYEPASTEAVAPPTDSIELSTYFESSSLTDEAIQSRRLDLRRHLSRESSLQLPSEPRRSILSWPSTAMLEGPDQDVESYPTTLVPYRPPPQQILPSSPLAEPERGTMTVYNQRLSLPPNVRRSTLSLLSSNAPSEMVLL